jgi:hypothetical protein
MAERQKDAGRREDLPYYVSIPYFQEITWENRSCRAQPQWELEDSFNWHRKISSEIDVSWRVGCKVSSGCSIRSTY